MSRELSVSLNTQHAGATTNRNIVINQVAAKNTATEIEESL
jgi:hypothetical protein